MIFVNISNNTKNVSSDKNYEPNINIKMNIHTNIIVRKMPIILYI